MASLRDTDIVVQVEPFEYRKPRNECDTKHQQCHDINRAIEDLGGTATIAAIIKKSGQDRDRVIDHVDHYSKNPSKPKLRIQRG